MRGERFEFLEPVHIKFDGTLPYQLYRIVPASPRSAPGGKEIAQQR
jgi:hypothetical protein